MNENFSIGAMLEPWAELQAALWSGRNESGAGAFPLPAWEQARERWLDISVDIARGCLQFERDCAHNIFESISRSDTTKIVAQYMEYVDQIANSWVEAQQKALDSWVDTVKKTNDVEVANPANLTQMWQQAAGEVMDMQAKMLGNWFLIENQEENETKTPSSNVKRKKESSITTQAA